MLAAVGVAQLVTHGSWIPGQSAALNHASGPGPVSSGLPKSTHRSRPKQATPSPYRSADSGYANPLRAVADLIPQRIDMGVDFAGTGPVYALGNAVVIDASSNTAGWPGGGWITYRLADGPGQGLVVYVAEDVRPDVRAGEQVTSSTVIATMFNGGAGIETGWAQPDSFSAESQLAAAGGISGIGPFPTEVGLNFEELLQSLGVPAANNRDQTPHGLLPAGYPAF